MRIKTETPKDIQPYYLAWMFVNPDEPRVWQEGWNSNWHFSQWIQSKHRTFKVDILGYPDSYWPYSDKDRATFKDWLFDQVGINETTDISKIS